MDLAGGSHAGDARAETATVDLRLLETTDLHVHLRPYDYYTDAPEDGVGLARTAALIARARAERRNSLLFDNGDMLQGSAIGDLLAHAPELALDTPHPAIAAMNAIGYDAATLGNHEFNFGLDYLLTALSGAAHPVVSANLLTERGVTPADDATLLPPYVLLDRIVTDRAGRSHAIRIGVLGLLPPQTVRWDRHLLEGRVETRDIVEAARGWAGPLREAGADLVVALCHSGIGGADAFAGQENAATALGAVPEIDAILAGHAHQVFPGPGFAGMDGVDPVAGRLCGVPAVMAGANGSHLGVIDLTLERRADNGWSVSAANCEARSIRGAAPENRECDPRVMAASEAAHRATRAHLDRPVTTVPLPLDTYFALLCDTPAVRIAAEAQAFRATELLAGTAHAGLPVLGAAAPLRAGGRAGPRNYTDIPAGCLSLRHLTALCPYANTLHVVVVTGAELRDWLERSASIFRQVPPGARDVPLVDPHVPSYNFDVFSGLSWRIDLGAPARYGREGRPIAPDSRRVRDLTRAGLPVADTDRFAVATNTFRANGGGGYPAIDPGRTLLASRETSRDALAAYLSRSGAAWQPSGERWRLGAEDGATVLFDTGPGADAHVPRNVRATRLGPLPSGFVRYRILL